LISIYIHYEINSSVLNIYKYLIFILNFLYKSFIQVWMRIYTIFNSETKSLFKYSINWFHEWIKWRNISINLKLFIFSFCQIFLIMLFAEITRWKNILNLLANFLIENLVHLMCVFTSVINHTNELIIMKNNLYWNFIN
jgi:hypothetical protein